MNIHLARIARFEWDVTRGRRDLVIVFVAFTIYLLCTSVLAIPAPTPPDSIPSLPAGLEDPVARLRLGFDLWSSVGTVFGNSFGAIAIVSGLLTCWIVGAEFDTGTIRTRLVADRSRLRLLVGKLLVGATIGTISACGGLLAGLLVAPLGAAVGSLPFEGLPTFDPGVVTALLVVMLVSLLAVTGALAITFLVRSAVLSGVVFLAAVFVLSSLTDLVADPDVAQWLPAYVFAGLLHSASPAGSNPIPSGAGILFPPAPPLVDVLLVVGWTVLLVCLAYAALRTRDVPT